MPFFGIASCLWEKPKTRGGNPFWGSLFPRGNFKFWGKIGPWLFRRLRNSFPLSKGLVPLAGFRVLENPKGEKCQWVMKDVLGMWRVLWWGWGNSIRNLCIHEKGENFFGHALLAGKKFPFFLYSDLGFKNPPDGLFNNLE